MSDHGPCGCDEVKALRAEVARLNHEAARLLLEKVAREFFDGAAKPEAQPAPAIATFEDRPYPPEPVPANEAPLSTDCSVVNRPGTCQPTRDLSTTAPVRRATKSADDIVDACAGAALAVGGPRVGACAAAILKLRGKFTVATPVRRDLTDAEADAMAHAYESMVDGSLVGGGAQGDQIEIERACARAAWRAAPHGVVPPVELGIEVVAARLFGETHFASLTETAREAWRRLAAEAIAAAKVLPPEPPKPEAPIRRDLTDEEARAMGEAWLRPENGLSLRAMASAAWRAAPHGVVPPVAVALRPVVQRFAEVMEAKLRENDHKGGWEEDSPSDLFARLMEESNELERSFEPVAGCVPVVHDAALASKVAREAADVANFAMMIADVCGGLRATKVLP